jgi:1,4-alpha-glucan branching enzyme
MHSFDFSGKLSRYSAKKIVKPVAFICRAVQARQVSIMGDFNDWDLMSHPMLRQSDGAWRVELPLNHGHHHYLFVVDGKPALDPRAQGVARNHKNEKVSLVAVS